MSTFEQIYGPGSLPSSGFPAVVGFRVGQVFIQCYTKTWWINCLKYSYPDHIPLQQEYFSYSEQRGLMFFPYPAVSHAIAKCSIWLRTCPTGSCLQSLSKTSRYSSFSTAPHTWDVQTHPEDHLLLHPVDSEDKGEGKVVTRWPL